MEENKDKNQKINNSFAYSHLNLRAISIFERDPQTLFIFKKAERIASAIYLITDFLSDNEPVKWKMRKVSTNLVSFSINLSNQGHQSRAQAEGDFLSASFEIISLLETANISGIISAMNYGILRFELEKIIELVDLKGRSLNSKFLLTKDFFLLGEGDQIIKGNAKTENKFVNERKDIGQDGNKTEDAETGFSKGQLNGQKQLKDINIMSFNKGQMAKSDKDKRYEIIINLLKNKKEITVKDVSGIISNCSEKTIQRELLGLVGRGVLKKEGERRWSRYSLA